MTATAPRPNDAPWLLDIEKVLVPKLREGDIVIMDNLGSHKRKAVRQLIRSAGAKLFFLPKYSPDLNPIEQVFAKLKHLLRKVGARQVEPSARRSAKSSEHSRPKNTPTISETQAMHQPKIIMLLAPAAARRPSPVHHSRG
jgi:transposase